MTTALFAMLSRGHPRGGHRRQLPPHPAVPEPDALALRHRGLHGARGRLRRLEDAISDDASTGERVAHEPLQPHPGSGAVRGHRPAAPRETVIDATFATPTTCGRSSGGSTWSCTRPPSTWAVTTTCWPGGAGLGRAGGARSAATGDHRRDRRSIRRLSPRPRAQDLRAPHGAQNANAQRWPSSCTRIPDQRGALRGPAQPSRARHRPQADARSAGSSPSRWRGIFDAATRVVDACAIPYIAASLGGVESLIEQPAIMSFLRAQQRGASRDRDQGQPDPPSRRDRGRRRSHQRTSPRPRPGLRLRLTRPPRALFSAGPLWYTLRKL